jgi:hypothetical protein
LVRENAADVQVGDDAYTGITWGKYLRFTVMTLLKVESISVVFLHTGKTWGI